MTNLYTTTEKTRGKPLNTYEAKGKKIAQARLLFIITYRPCKRACINIQNISFVRSYLCLFFLFFARSVSFFFPVLGLLIYRHVDDWYTRYSITHGSNQGKTKRYPMQFEKHTRADEHGRPGLCKPSFLSRVFSLSCQSSNSTRFIQNQLAYSHKKNH